MTFTIDGQAETPVSLADVGGADEAQFVTSTLTVGQHSVSAAYSGDTNVSQSRIAADADGERPARAGHDDDGDVLVKPVERSASR